MKNIRILIILMLVIISFNSCKDEDEFIFIASEAKDLAFSTTFLDEYLLNPTVASNIAERFTWNDADFDVPSEVTYKLQYSLSSDFSIFDEDLNTLGSTSDNELPVTIGQMLTIAEEAGLDNDPNTDDKPNTGELYFRLKAVLGLDGLESFSEIQSLTVILQEIVVGSGIEKSSWGVVGSGYNDWGGFTDAPFYTTATAGVIVSYVNLVDGEIKFRENNTWGGDLGDANNDGVLDADPDNNIAVTAGDYKITINTNDNSYTIEPFSWGVVGSGFNNWGAILDAKLYYDYTTDTFKASVKLFDGKIKFRMNNAWDVNFGDANLDGILDTDDNNNIAVAEGHYLITVNLNDNSYAIDAAPVWGAVGSGFNDWGGATWDHDGDSNTPDENVSDAALTEIQPGVWFAENITLLDGEIKFRADNTWSGDLGDANLDGYLDGDADNNIAVVAGNYVISIDFNDAGGPKYFIGKR